jgi:DNA relaxase NicK
MQTSFTLDYVAATTKIHSISQVIEHFSYGMSTEEWLTSKAHNGYEHSMRHPYGHYVQWTTKRDDMGVNIHFSGMPLKELHDTGHNTLDIVYWLCEEEFKFSRIDLAIDVHGVKFVLDDLQRAKFTGSVNKKPILIKDGPDNEEGSTLYIGSWSSDKFIRIYDKKAITEGHLEEWFRFELETGGKTATKIAKLIYNMTDAQVGKFTAGVMKAMFNADHPDYQAVMDAEPVKVSSTKDVSHSTYDWLMSSIAPVLARVSLELPHRDVMRTFEQEVQKHIRELAAKSLKKSGDL